ncbi:SIR2 family NAD-dependent protein deacylase [Afifella pfennigii]|uniref:SIR2 family NAD-dependent protein deacylase n=1 Tax=Afifella pfennigii TaxID=209897 RepID=UPI0006914CF7|nr:SIR2 family protein [Afifella pfennigii]
MSAPLERPAVAERGAALAAIADGLAQGRLIPYLGPGVLEEDAGGEDGGVPKSHGELAAFLAAKVALPGRARGNAFAAAQFIETRRHRKTLNALMAQAFGKPVTPSALHGALARLSQIPLIVDTWYDGAMRAALSCRSDWGEAQGICRAGVGEARWYAFYDVTGAEIVAPPAHGWASLLYKPHGAAAPAGNFLVADADYVEVLTEIDIQTPIPELVKTRRRERGFVFLGCRFDEQTLRLYARQIMKRSRGPHYALVAPERLTRNEWRFLASQAILPVAASPDCLAEALAPRA